MASYHRGDRLGILDIDSGQTLDWTVIDVFFLGSHRMVALLHVDDPSQPLMQLMEHPRDGSLHPIADPVLQNATVARFKARRGGK